MTTVIRYDFGTALYHGNCEVDKQTGEILSAYLVRHLPHGNLVVCSGDIINGFLGGGWGPSIERFGRLFGKRREYETDAYDETNDDDYDYEEEYTND